MCILTADLNLRWAAMFNCVTVSHWSCCFFNRGVVQNLLHRRNGKGYENAREINTSSQHILFVFISYTCTGIKFPA